MLQYLISRQPPKVPSEREIKALTLGEEAEGDLPSALRIAWVSVSMSCITTSYTSSPA